MARGVPNDVETAPEAALSRLQAPPAPQRADRKTNRRGVPPTPGRGREPAPLEEISACQLGRLIGELGPLEDFSSLTGVEKYVGLNLRRRQSGNYEGEVKITKKGRPLARKILGQMAYQPISKNRLFAEYCRRKKEEGMPRPKAQVAVTRKLLKLIVGLYKSRRPYDRSRVFTCRSQYESVSGGTG